jgi:hypothetical protein
MGNLQHQAALPLTRVSVYFKNGYERFISKGQLFLRH